MDKWNHLLSKFRKPSGFKKLHSSIPENNIYLNRVPHEIYITGMPNQMFWTFDFIDQIKDLISFDEIKNILDIGSRDCLQSVEFSIWFPDSNIYAFEANPNQITWCEKMASSRSNIEIIPMAACQTNGTCEFYIVPPNNNAGTSSLLKNNSDHPLSKNWIGTKTTVPCTRIDSWAGSKDLDLVWMDVQGAELDVLYGFGSKLQNVKAIFTEVGVGNRYHGDSGFEALENFMSHNGFRSIAYISHEDIHSKDFSSNVGEIDVVYVNNKL